MCPRSWILTIVSLALVWTTAIADTKTAPPLAHPKESVPDESMTRIKKLLDEVIAKYPVETHYPDETYLDAFSEVIPHLFDADDITKYDAELEQKGIVLAGHRNAGLRRAGMMLLDRCAGEQGAKALAAVALEGADGDDRRYAVGLLRLVGGQEEALATVLQSDPDPLNRAHAALSLALLQSTKHLALIEHQFEVVADIDAKRLMLGAIGAMGDPRSMPLVLRQLDSDSDVIAGEAAMELGLCGDERAIEPLLRCAEAREPGDGVRAFALQSLWRLFLPEDRSLFDPLGDNIREAWEQQKETYRLEDALRTAVTKAATEEERGLVIQRIRMQRMRVLAPDLRKALAGQYGKEPVTRFRCVRVLAEWGDKEALQMLVDYMDPRGLLKDIPPKDRAFHREEALRVLRQRTGQNFFLNLAKWREYLAGNKASEAPKE